MKLEISVSLTYRLPEPVDLMLQVEAASGGGQHVESASLDLGEPELFSRVPASDGTCEPVWMRTSGTLRAAYRATVAIDRPLVDFRALLSEERRVGTACVSTCRSQVSPYQ